MPVDQIEACLIECYNLQRFLAGNCSPSPLRLWAKSFETLLLSWVCLAMARASRLEFDLVSLQKLAHAAWICVAYAAPWQECVSLSDRGDLALLHGLLQLRPRLLGDELPSTTLARPAHQQFLRTFLAVSDEPPLALAAAVAQSLGRSA
jgi:hypothetical protein